MRMPMRTGHTIYDRRTVHTRTPWALAVVLNTIREIDSWASRLPLTLQYVTDVTFATFSMTVVQVIRIRGWTKVVNVNCIHVFRKRFRLKIPSVVTTLLRVIDYKVHFLQYTWPIWYNELTKTAVVCVLLAISKYAELGWLIGWNTANYYSVYCGNHLDKHSVHDRYAIGRLRPCTRFTYNQPFVFL